VIVAHLSDLHLRSEEDAVAFGLQLDRIRARGADHLVITGDLLDRWSPALLEHGLDVLAARGLLHRERTTIIHGNHDLASSGGHPRRRRDLWRLAARSWDPPPLLAVRMRAFHRRIAFGAEGVSLPPATLKSTASGLHLVTVDTVTAPWWPMAIGRRTLTLRHGEGAIPDGQLDWLSRQRAKVPLVVLVHHYPLPIAPYEWKVEGARRWRVLVRMEIKPDDRARFWKAVEQSGAIAVLCGHVHRARLEHYGRVTVALNGQSGAAWAGHTVAYYTIEETSITVQYESVRRGA